MADHILRQLERRYGWSNLSMVPEASKVIERRDWPGNVRQLENALARAAIAARGRAILPDHLDAEPEPSELSATTADEGDNPLPLRAILAEVERRTIRRALVVCKGNRTKTAERLGISRRQLFDKIRDYGLDS